MEIDPISRLENLASRTKNVAIHLLLSIHSGLSERDSEVDAMIIDVNHFSVSFLSFVSFHNDDNMESIYSPQSLSSYFDDVNMTGTCLSLELVLTLDNTLVSSFQLFSPILSSSNDINIESTYSAPQSYSERAH